MNKYEKDFFNKIFELEREYFEKDSYSEEKKLQILINESLKDNFFQEYTKFSKEKWKELALEKKLDEVNLEKIMKDFGK